MVHLFVSISRFTLIIMFVFGLMIERFLIRVLLNKKASPIYVVLSTIALSIVLMNMAQQIWGSLSASIPVNILSGYGGCSWFGYPA